MEIEYFLSYLHIIQHFCICMMLKKTKIEKYFVTNYRYTNAHMKSFLNK